MSLKSKVTGTVEIVVYKEHNPKYEEMIDFLWKDSADGVEISDEYGEGWCFYTPVNLFLGFYSKFKSNIKILKK